MRTVRPIESREALNWRGWRRSRVPDAGFGHSGLDARFRLLPPCRRPVPTPLPEAAMSLSIPQRLQRLEARIEEILCWRERETEPIPHWTFDGRPLPSGGTWPHAEG